MKTTLTVLGVLVLAAALAGCGGPAGETKLLTVDFSPGQTIRYEFTSYRMVDIAWGEEAKSSSGCCGGERKDDSQASKTSERMDIVVAYRPVEADPFGPTVIEATCESVKVNRRSKSAKRGLQEDAVNSLKGRTFTFTVTPAGKIEDYSQLDQLIRDIGKKAFRQAGGRGRIKEPDMIGDFIVSQWFLWDAVASIENPAQGVRVGQTWKSKLSIPTPMVMRKARDVTYRLAEIRQSKNGELAVIRSSYSLAESVPSGWPIPYRGKMQLRGMFGFLTNYNVLDLKGEGEEIFNIDTGRTEEYKQQYKMWLDASMRFPLGPKPVVTIDQLLTMKRIK